MKEHISRREFLSLSGKAAAVVLGVPTLGVCGAEAASREITRKAIEERSRLPQPKLLDHVPPSSVSYGSYPDKNSLITALKSGEKIGQKPQILGFFVHGNEPFKRNPEYLSQINRAAEQGILPIVSWGMKLTEVDFDLLADHFSLIKSDFGARFLFEMNGPWAWGENGWYGDFTVDEFKNAWRRLREVFAKRVPRAHFIFSPNSTDGALPFEELFPGEDQVEFVGLDSYNKYSPDPLNPLHFVADLPPELAFGPDIATFQRIAPNTPFILTEINAVDDGPYLKNALSFANRADAKAKIIFDWQKKGQGVGEIDWAVVGRPPLLRDVRDHLDEDPQIKDLPAGQESIEQTLDSLRVRVRET